jgi:sec-independent protein translocase protein TatA
VKGFKDGVRDGTASADATATPPSGQVTSSTAHAPEKTTIDVESKNKS